MKKLRFKNRNGILYFGIGDKFKSSKLAYNNVNKNIIKSRYVKGEIDQDLQIQSSLSCFINDLIQKVLDDKAKHLKHKSMIAYKSSASNHIFPYFDNKMVSEIKPIHIKEFQDTMVAQGLKKQSVQFARILLKEAFEIAVLSEQLLNNPVSAVSMPKIKYKKEKYEPFTLDEIDSILSHTQGELRNFLGISFFTGMRSGEVLALQWSDIDFQQETISINKTIAQGVINEPKTRSSEREIEMLDTAKEFFQNQRRETGICNNYVFLNTKANHYSSNDTFYKKYQSVLQELGFEKRPLHNTRHTFASIMLNNAIDPLWVSRTLGHENVQITLSIYTHFMPKKEKISLPFLEKRYKNGTTSI